MPKNISYNRIFIMLQEESKGFGRGGKPTGYFKIENKERKTKYQLHVQNIGVSAGNKVLKAYVLSEKSMNSKPYCIGTLEIKNDCGDLSGEYTREDLKESGLELADVDSVVVVCKDIGMEDGYQMYPLIGFKNKPWNWKDAFVGSFNKSTDSLEDGLNQEVYEKEEIVQEKKNPIGFIWPNAEEASDQCENVGNELELQSKTVAELIENLDSNQTAEEAIHQDAAISEELQDTVELEAEEDDSLINSINERAFEEKESDTSCEAISKQGKPFFEYPKERKVLSESITDYLKDKKKANVFQGATAIADWYIVYDIAFIPSILITKCGFHPNAQNDKTSMNLMVINDPNVLRAVRRYGHYLVSVQKDVNDNVVNIVFGIPGRFGVEPHPLLYVQAYANWIPHKDYKKMIGGFGYWTIGVDIISGEFTIVQG